MSDQAAGRIITFYSYKGGTGRSMALANVAWILASNRKRVLVVDWDLEAPGLHRYFAPFLADRGMRASDGVIEFLSRYADAVLTPPTREEETGEDWYLGYADITRLATSLDWKFPKPGALDFIGAGRQGAAYPSRVANFPWQAFYERLGGGPLLDAARARMKEQYDYVLLDSRTGVSDTAGICTIQLPDALVVCFTLNNQSIVGAASVAQIVNTKTAGPTKPAIPILPVPMRVEQFEKDKLATRRKYARSQFTLFPNHIAASERDAYWGAMEVLYDPYYAYEELLAAFGDEPGRPASLLAAMERLTSYVTAGEVGRLPPMPEAVRIYNRDLYAQQSDDQDLPREAERVFGELPVDVHPSARRFLTRLVRVGRPDEGGVDGRARVPARDLAGGESALRAFSSAGLVRVEADPTLLEEFVELADDALVQRWPRLRQWVDGDREFLLWRQQLRSYIADWERTGRDVGALLSGKPLDEALTWSEGRPADLTEHEREYVEACRALERQRQSEREEEQRRVQALAAERQNWLEREAQLTSSRAELESARVGRRRARWVTATAGSVLLVLLGLVGTWAKRQQGDAALERRRNQAESLVDSGDAALTQRRVDLALSYFGRALALDSSSERAYIGRAAVYETRGHYDLAVAQYDSLIATDSNSADVYYRRGVAYGQLGRTGRAVVDLDRAIRLQPTAAAYYWRGVLRDDAGNVDSAIKDYDRAIELDTAYAEAYFRRGQLYATRSDTARAIADFRRVREVATPEDSVTRQAAATRLTRLGRAPVNPPVRPSDTLVARLTVVVQFRDENDRKAVDELRRALRARTGWIVTAPDLVPQVDTGANPVAYNGIRFFHEKDRAFAERVATAAAAALAQQGFVVTLPAIYVRPSRFRRAPQGQVELWLPPLERNNARYQKRAQ